MPADAGRFSLFYENRSDYISEPYSDTQERDFTQGVKIKSISRKGIDPDRFRSLRLQSALVVSEIDHLNLIPACILWKLFGIKMSSLSHSEVQYGRLSYETIRIQTVILWFVMADQPILSLRE